MIFLNFFFKNYKYSTGLHVCYSCIYLLIGPIQPTINPNSCCLQFILSMKGGGKGWTKGGVEQKNLVADGHGYWSGLLWARAQVPNHSATRDGMPGHCKSEVCINACWVGTMQHFSTSQLVEPNFSKI